MDARIQLLNNLLDALDRFFDRESGVADVAAIIYASSRALPEDRHAIVLAQAAKALKAIIGSGATANEAHDKVLEATNSLRIALAEDPTLNEK